jgi:hypothetical protein
LNRSKEIKRVFTFEAFFFQNSIDCCKNTSVEYACLVCV